MNKQKEIAVKVMELANEFAGWNFQMEKEGNIYHVGTTLQNQKGQNMVIDYQIGERNAQLTVYSSNCRYDDCYVGERINAIPLDYPVYAVGMGINSFSINTPMSIEVLESQIGTIVMRRMADMVGAVTDIIGYTSKNSTVA